MMQDKSDPLSLMN